MRVCWGQTVIVVSALCAALASSATLLAQTMGRATPASVGLSADRLALVTQDLQTFYEQRIFRPLGMTDTVFYVDPTRGQRLARVRLESWGHGRGHGCEHL